MKEVYYFVTKEEGNVAIPPAKGWECQHRVTLRGKAPNPTCTELSFTRKRRGESQSDMMTKMWKQRKFTDAEVVCDGTRIPVHRSRRRKRLKSNPLPRS